MGPAELLNRNGTFARRSKAAQWPLSNPSTA
jgi:hypothetical protein